LQSTIITPDRSCANAKTLSVLKTRSRLKTNVLTANMPVKHRHDEKHMSTESIQ
jgi:hypothetical protein